MNTALLDTLQQEIDRLDAQGLRRRRRTTETACAPNLMLDGQRVLSFNSNDYLGLAADERIAAALKEGVSLYGAGSGASHLVSGHSKAHEALEERLAAFEAPHLERARALYFSTGYMANLAVLTALAAATPGEAEIFSDALNHASIIDGTRLSRAKVTVFPHADVAALEAGLAASTAQQKIVVTDSVFSMDGDLAPLPALLALCERFGAWLVVDDAHGFGVLGEHGRGALEHFQLRSPQLVYMGTLGKAAGVSGAFVAAHETVIDWLVQRARPYIYTTAAAPALAHALLTSLDLIASQEGQQRRAQLDLLRHQLSEPAHGLPGVAQASCRDGMQGFGTPQTARQDACPSGWGEIGRFAHQIPCMGSEPMRRDLGGQLIPIAPQRDPCETVSRLSAMPVRHGWSHLASATPIQPLVIGGNTEVMAAAQALEAQGLWVSAIRAPTVPAGTARLRITLSAAHTHDDVERLLAALGQLAQEA